MRGIGIFLGIVGGKQPMKYCIKVGKLDDGSYLAYCPLLKNMHASGESMNSALANLHQGFVCFLHDPQAEFEIVSDKRHDGLNTKDGLYL